MAKNATAAAEVTQAENPAATVNGANGEQVGAAVTTTTQVKDGSKVMLTNGEARVDYIKRRFAEGATRSTITKEVNSLKHEGTPAVPYQVIFAATKKKKEEAATVEGAAAAA